MKHKLKIILDTLKNISIISIIRIELFLIVTLCSLIYFLKFSTPESFEKRNVLSILISTIAIIIAIIITYLFSKLFSEKTDRIQRKYEIDKLSNKITKFRKIAFHIKGFYQFWKIGENDVKSKMDNLYNFLVYEDLRNDKYPYEKLTPIIRDVGETAIQAYLALKGLENNETTISFYQKFILNNYTLDEISRFSEYSNSFWYFLDRSPDDIVNFNKENRYSLNFIDELFFEITGKQIDKNNYNSEIKNLFNYFQSEIFPKHYYLTKLNMKILPEPFMSSILNILIFISLLISSIILFIPNFEIFNEYFFTILIVSLFIANTIDLITLTVIAIKNELIITEFYRL